MFNRVLGLFIMVLGKWQNLKSDSFIPEEWKYTIFQCFNILFKFFKYLFIYFQERERANECREGAEGERVLSKLHAELGALHGASCRDGCRAGSQDPEIMTWAKTKSQSLNWLHHPSVPQCFNILFFLRLIHFRGGWRAEGEGQRKSPSRLPTGMEPKSGPIPGHQDNDLRWNQESSFNWLSHSGAPQYFNILK